MLGCLTGLGGACFALVCALVCCFGAKPASGGSVWISWQLVLHSDEGCSMQAADPAQLQKQQCRLGKVEP